MATKRAYRFFFHYNKPESRKRGVPILSVHYKGQCMLTENLTISVPTSSKKNKRQPHMVITGQCNSIDITDKSIKLYNTEDKPEA